MAQPTEIYVDPAIAGDSGAGTIGDPFGDLEWAIEQTTFDTTNGTRVNIKAGTDEVLAADLSNALADVGTTAAWAPSEQAPCIFQGYTTTAGDGGKGGISGGGSVSIFNAPTQDYVSFIDIHAHNTGANVILNLNDGISLLRCEFDNSTADLVAVDAIGVVMGCKFHNGAAYGLTMRNSRASFNSFENGTNDFTSAINCEQQTSCERNLIKIDGASNGIRTENDNHIIEWNSIWSNGGTGAGVIITGVNKTISILINNMVEGFSGAGGIGFALNATSSAVFVYAGNAAYNNTTNYAAPSDYVLDDWKGIGNETLTASPFTDAANGDFSPVDTGSVKEGSIPYNFGDGQ